MITLNEAQQAAVSAGDGPALVLAGAGSGKTRVIIERLVWLVEERGVDPRNLLALTFTNRAAGEMRMRMAERLGVERVPSWLGTFHSFGLFILRREMEHLGRPKAFTIFDDSDQLSLMKRLVKALPTKFEKVSPRDALTWISQLKQQVEEPESAEEGDDETEVYRELWTRYHATLRRASAVDFDDLLVLVVKLFQEHAEVLSKYQNRYRYVLIDEYQDTNRAQYLIARLLTESHRNLFVVGDEDQSVYSWRGADINNILDFAKDFEGAMVHRLEQNYRSTKPILDAANAVVANNINRLGKTLWTDKREGEGVRIFEAESGDEEASFVADDMVKRGLSPGNIAVLYRTNAQARLMEEALRKKGLHYIVVGGIKFYSRKEIKDILSYLRLLVNPDDEVSLRRVLNVPPRGIGGVSLERLEEYAAQRKSSLFQVLREVETDDTLSARARSAVGEFVRLVDDLALEARTSAVAPLVNALLEKVGYREYVQRSDEKDFRSRLEIVDEFINACAQYDKENKQDLLSFLQDLSLLSDVDDWDAGEPAVTLMTCHSAKGLEFDHVYLIGLEEGLLPYVREFDGDDDVEEERRLCYVAMTRAQKDLTLTAAQSRMLYGRTDRRELSRFVREVGRERLKDLRAGPVTRKAPAKAASADHQSMKMGMRVRHAKFGLGTVSYTRGAGDKLKARIRFDTGRTALLMVSLAPLEIVKGKQR
jgi:DNA helicase-2/ATP-dependent DNA helicase PcrA